MIRVTPELGALRHFESAEEFVTWLYERMDNGGIIARYDTDEELFQVLHNMGEAGGAKVKAAQMVGEPITELWSHDHWPDGPGWRVQMVRKQIQVPQVPPGQRRPALTLARG